MPSVTLSCHPAALYYFLHDEMFERENDLSIDGITINRTNDTKLAMNLMSRIDIEDAKNDETLIRDITIDGEDEALLFWIKLAGPHPGTPPRDF